MSSYLDWEERWYGVWREYGPNYSDCPSIKDFVVPDVNALYNKVSLRQNLTTARVVAACSKRSFLCPFTGEEVVGSISYRTDGKWLWLDDLADYIDNFGVAIPPAWLTEIERSHFVPPKVSDEDIEHLSWPPVLPRSIAPTG